MNKEIFDQKILLNDNQTICRIMAIYGPDYMGGRYNSNATGKGSVIYRLQNKASGKEYFKKEEEFTVLKVVKLLAHIDAKKVITWAERPLKRKGLKRHPIADMEIDQLK